MSNLSILEKLDAFIDSKSPRMAKFLYRMWDDQQDAITYRELREAILDGSLSTDYLQIWQQDYSFFLSDCYAPMAQQAIEAAKADLVATYGFELYDPMMDAMDNYISTHGSELIREISNRQFNAINTLVREAAMTGSMTVDQLAHAIRPCIGLTDRQIAQTKRFYDQLRENGVSHKKALGRQITYAAKLHRRRAASIAQTELARAYNYAAQQTIEDSISYGFCGEDSTKYWITARDEGVCSKCGQVNGEEVGIHDNFSNGCFLPPGHTSCRCGAGYRLTRAKHKSP